MPSQNNFNISDTELLDNYYKFSDTDTLGILLKRYTIMIFGVSMKYLKNEEDAKDAVQQIFEKVILELGKYKITYFKSWLYMVAKNYCLMRLRGKSNFSSVIIEDINETADEENIENNALIKDREFTNLSIALNKLNDEQRVCITLFYLDKKTYSQISEIANYSVLQVKSNIQNGKRNLKKMLQSMTINE